MMHTPLALLALIAACGGTPEKTPTPVPAPTGGTWTKPSDAELRARLSPEQYAVTQQNGTEAPFKNAYFDNHTAGLYVDIASGEPLFASSDKFDSGTGWPSFVRPIDPARVVEKRDSTHGMTRVEVRSRSGDSHLGHVFDDGPAPTGLRYCINSASLRFIPLAELEAQGYGAWRARVEGVASEIAVLAGGCFWGMEEILRKIPGVLDTEVGYMADAEAVRVVFDPKKLAYAALLEKWYFRMHDPTTQNRQGNDIGEQYRSAIFATSPEQKKIAAQVKAKVDASGFWERKIVTEIVDAGEWTRAEESHQDYLEKHPDGYTCHYLRE